MTRPSDIQVNAGAGLGTTEARLRLSKIGPNEPVSSRRTSGLVQILFLLINPRSGRLKAESESRETVNFSRSFHGLIS